MRRTGNPALFGGLAIGLLVLDQLTKYWARHAAEFTEGRTIFPLWPGVFELKLVFNKGIAFGMLQGGGILLAPIAIIIGAAATYYSFRQLRTATLIHVTMALLVSGAIGNLIDRLVMGKVTDMFWIRVINFPVFNVADICITVAGFLLAGTSLMEILRPAPTTKADPAPVLEPDEDVVEPRPETPA